MGLPPTAIRPSRWIAAALCLAWLASAGPASAADPEQAYAPAGGTPPAETLRGTACAVDGDTLRLGGRRTAGRCRGGLVVHLTGLDAPEKAQKCRARLFRMVACGRYALSRLTARIRGRELRCEARRRPGAAAWAGTCHVGAENLNAALVRHGWAAVNHADDATYAAEERAARTARRGIWQTDFIPPWEWRLTGS